jgi:integrase
MPRRAEATLWIQIKQGDKNRYVAVRKVGNGRFVPNIEGPFEPGPYYLRYTQDKKRKWECVGPELALALNEQRNRQTALDRGKPPETPEDRKPLSRAIESYLAEVRTRRGEKAVKRAEWLLELFASVTKKHFIDEITRDTLFLFMAYLKDQGRSPKTLRDRLQSIETFRKSFELPPLLKKGDLPKVVKKIVDCYAEQEVQKMLAVADEDERFLILFLLATGVREQEAAHTVWTDIKWAGKVLRVSAKPACHCPHCGPDGFNIKDYEEREIPLPDWFMAVLKTRKKTATRDLIFYNSNGNPQGHFLYTLKSVGKRAGIKCENCKVVGSRLSCKRHAVTTHKWRRTFATWHHVLGGVSVAILQNWLGHSDIETTMRYIATTEIRSQFTRERVAQTWAGFATGPKVKLAVVA